MKRFLLIAALAACKGGGDKKATDDKAPDAAPAVAKVETKPDAGPPAPDAAAPLLGADFTLEARLLYTIAACGPTVGQLPPQWDQGVIDKHCKALNEDMADYRAKYFDKGRAFFDELVPDDVPKTVVYPFGGGDLVSALVAFPDAMEITTISLEMSGDPRRINTIDKKGLEDSLAALRSDIGGLLQSGSNTSDNLQLQQENQLPGQVSSFLMGMVAGGYEPVGMRYFRLEDDGSIHYLETAEIEAIEAEQKKAKRRAYAWGDPNFSEAFAHVEIRYRKLDDPPGLYRVHRHLGWNLGDDELAAHPQLIKHLEAKGKVTVLTKGASYLLWRSDFATIRSYMLANLAWMLSDSTGIPPMYAKKAGMEQLTWGTYTGPFLPGAVKQGRHNEDFIALWEENPHQKMPFRYGYVDAEKHPHIVVTRPKP